MPPRKHKAPKVPELVAPEPEAIWVDRVQKNGKRLRSVQYKPNVQQPCVMGRHLDELNGHRYARRPSYLARAAGVFNATQLKWADSYDPPDDWAADEEMPSEGKLEDCGWLPGPASRELPPFRGPTPGPTDSKLLPSSCPELFLNTQLTDEFKKKVVTYTIAHCEQYQHQNPDWRARSSERAMMNFKKAFDVGVFESWLACRMRVAQLKPEVRAEALWNRKSSLFDTLVFNSMTFHQWKWINKHISFADVENENDTSDDESEVSDEEQVSDNEPEEDEYEEAEELDEGGEHDTAVQHKSTLQDSHRKRRELTDLACQTFGAAWRPHQFIGLDEAVRAHKHWARERIRFKAAVHSRSLVDSMNDCESKYCLWFEEQHWLKKEAGEEDPHTIASRLCHALRSCYVTLIRMGKGSLHRRQITASRSIEGMVTLRRRHN